MAKQYYVTEAGEALYPWLNKPDTAFNNEDGLFHTQLLVDGDKADRMMEIIEGAAKKALAEHTDDMSAGKAKDWSLHLPFEPEVDSETAEETGRIKFNFKQNATIKLKDGGEKKVEIEIRDSKDNIVDVQVWGGSTIRVMYSLRPIVMTSSKKVGIRLDFYKVQVIKLQKGTSKGFGSVDGGYEQDAGFGTTEDTDGGDY